MQTFLEDPKRRKPKDEGKTKENKTMSEKEIKYYEVKAVNLSKKTQQDWQREFSKVKNKDIWKTYDLSMYQSIKRKVNKTKDYKITSQQIGYFYGHDSSQENIRVNSYNIDTNKHPYVILIPTVKAKKQTYKLINEIEYYVYDSKRNRFFPMNENDEMYSILRRHFTGLK